MKIKFETFLTLAMFAVFTASMIGAAIDIHEMEETNKRNSQLYIEVCQKLDAVKHHQTYSWVSLQKAETPEEDETQPKDFPTVESYNPNEDEDPTDPYKPGADERPDQSNDFKEVQAPAEDAGLAGSDEHRSSIPLETCEMWKPSVFAAMRGER